MSSVSPVSVGVEMPLLPGEAEKLAALAVGGPSEEWMPVADLIEISQAHLHGPKAVSEIIRQWAEAQLPQWGDWLKGLIEVMAADWDRALVEYQEAPTPEGLAQLQFIRDELESLADLRLLMGRRCGVFYRLAILDIDAAEAGLSGWSGEDPPDWVLLRRKVLDPGMWWVS